MTKSDGYIKLLKMESLRAFQDCQVKIVLFGSRARADQTRYSDVDIGIIPRSGKGHFRAITAFRDRVEEMNIPYKVDVVDFSEVSSSFAKQALKEGKIWKD